MKYVKYVLILVGLCLTSVAHAFSFSMPSFSASGIYVLAGAGVVNVKPNLSTPAGVLASTEG